jgi:peptidyl-prolyl cis-trans isomerase C
MNRIVINRTVKDRVMTFTLPLRRGLSAGLFAAALLIAAQAPTMAQTPAATPAATGADQVLARVNGVEIKQSDLALAEEDLGANMPQIPPEAKRDYLVTYLADIIMVAQDAEKKKVQDSDTFKQRSNFIRKKLLMGQYLQTEGKSAVTDDAMRKVYDDAVKQMGDEPEVHARHILFRAEAKDEAAGKAAEAKAKAVVERLKKGEDFAKLANELTEDPSGKASGGDLGYFAKEQMVPQFAEVAFKLDKGKVSDPVKTDFGWHVIKVEDKRNKPAPEFDKVKPQLEDFVVQKAQADIIGKLRTDAKIEKLYAAAPATPGAPAAPAAPEKK